MIEDFLKNHPTGILDYCSLMGVLSNYKKPRDKITQLLERETIIRVKKGLYIVGEKYCSHLISKEILANLIYGPSYISLEYALSFWGLIPERVEIVTSITTQKSKEFATTLGVFRYTSIPIKKYSIGVILQPNTLENSFLIACKEKAVIDMLYLQKIKANTEEELLNHLVQNLRINPADLQTFRLSQLDAIDYIYQTPITYLLFTLIKKLKS